VENNPYTPPAAGVADIAMALRPRPRAVNIALVLIGGALLIQLLFQLWHLQQMNFQIVAPMQTAFAAGLFLLYGLLCQQLAQGRSWPRIVLLILTLGGFASTCFAIGYARNLDIPVGSLMTTPVFLFNRLLPMILNFIALHLLFFPGGTWFRQEPD